MQCVMSSGLQCTKHFGCGMARIMNVFKCVERHCGVDRVIAERHSRCARTTSTTVGGTRFCSRVPAHRKAAEGIRDTRTAAPIPAQTVPSHSGMAGAVRSGRLRCEDGVAGDDVRPRSFGGNRSPEPMVSFQGDCAMIGSLAQWDGPSNGPWGSSCRSLLPDAPP